MNRADRAPAPWPVDTVHALNARQANPRLVALTCPAHPGVPLWATVHALVCAAPGCRYTRTDLPADLIV